MAGRALAVVQPAGVAFTSACAVCKKKKRSLAQCRGRYKHATPDWWRVRDDDAAADGARRASVKQEIPEWKCPWCATVHRSVLSHNAERWMKSGCPSRACPKQATHIAETKERVAVATAAAAVAAAAATAAQVKKVAAAAANTGGASPLPSSVVVCIVCSIVPTRCALSVKCIDTAPCARIARESKWGGSKVRPACHLSPRGCRSSCTEHGIADGEDCAPRRGHAQGRRQAQRLADERRPPERTGRHPRALGLQRPAQDWYSARVRGPRPPPKKPKHWRQIVSSHAARAGLNCSTHGWMGLPPPLLTTRTHAPLVIRRGKVPVHQQARRGGVLRRHGRAQQGQGRRLGQHALRQRRPHPLCALRRARVRHHVAPLRERPGRCRPADTPADTHARSCHRSSRGFRGLAQTRFGLCRARALSVLASTWARALRAARA